MAHAAPTQRSQYRDFLTIQPRWNEIDSFGHVNNAEFYTWFDTAVVRFLQGTGAWRGGPEEPLPLVVESRARFHAEVVFGDRVEVGVLVERLGRSSVSYGFGVFLNGGDDAAVDGGFTHVFADRRSRRPVAIPDAARHAFRSIAPAEATT